GFTAQSVVLSPEMKEKGYWRVIDTTAYQAIEQGVVLLKAAKDREEMARKFYQFLFSPKAKDILTTFGYTTVNRTQ
ncbi:MAG: substrate-binding domain-containing protein, partial [Bacteroidota bacterium]